MKIYKYINLLAIVLGLFLVACDPIEDRDVLENSFDPATIELKVSQATPGGNKITLLMNTPGVTGYWDYGFGTTLSDRSEVVFPLVGKHVFTYCVSTPYLNSSNASDIQYIKKTIEVQVDKIVVPVSPNYEFLLGTDAKKGKTWAFDRTDPAKWWYMTDADWTAFWWQPDTCTDMDGHMVFSYDAGTKFSSFKDATATAVKGKWSVNSDFTKLTISGDVNLLGVEDGGVNNTGSKTYEIKELTATRMVLFQNDMAWSPGWVWVFKSVSN